jgi:hypothetical protein
MQVTFIWTLILSAIVVDEALPVRLREALRAQSETDGKDVMSRDEACNFDDHRSEGNSQGPRATSNTISEFVEDLKGRILSVSPWHRRPYAFEARHHCKDEPTLTEAFAMLDENTGGKITSKDVENDFDNELVGLRFFIKDGRVTHEVKKGRKEGILQARVGEYVALIQDLLNEVELPDMQFAVSLLDRSPGTAVALKTEGVPGQDLLMIPRSLVDWGKQSTSLVEESMKNPCSSKQTQAVFRGATTGGFQKWNASAPDHPLLTSDRRPLPRYEVAALSQDRPELLDAGFTTVVQADEPARFTEVLKKRGMLRDFLSDQDQRCYGAVVVVDGNSLPDRLPRQLAYGIPVVFLHEKADEFWYKELQAGTDYVQATTSTLAAVLEKLQARPDLSRCIGKNGQSFVLEHLSQSRLKCYLYKLLSEYGKRYQRSGSS